MNTYTDEEITKGLTQEQIDITIEVLKQINFRSAYGHNATYCMASNKLLGLLDRTIPFKYVEKDEEITNNKSQVPDVCPCCCTIKSIMLKDDKLVCSRCGAYTILDKENSLVCGCLPENLCNCPENGD